MVCAGSRFGGKDACQVIRGLNANENFPNPGGSEWNRAQQVPPTFSVAFAPEVFFLITKPYSYEMNPTIANFDKKFYNSKN